MANENFIKNAEEHVNSDKESAGLISFEEANVVSDNASVSDIDNLINQLNAKKQEIMSEAAEVQTSDDDGSDETSVLDMKVEDLSDNTEKDHDSDNHDVEYFVLDSGNTENDAEAATPESAVEPAAEEPQEAKSEADHADAEPVVETAEADAEVTNEPEPEVTEQAAEPEPVEEPEEKSIADLKAEKLSKMLHEDEVKEEVPVEEPVKPRRRRGRPSTVVSDKASNEITTEYMLEVLNSNFSDIKDEELESRLFDYMSKRLVIDISKDYKSDIYQDAFVKRLFLWFVEDEEFVNNPLFDILIKECMDKEVNCEYLNPELTHKILEHIMSKDVE